MPQRCPDIFGWRRTVMSPAGPCPITRLVLEGMSLFMDGSGAGCWAGVRCLAEITGLDKSTVAKHRSLAIADGWLIAADNRPRNSRYRKFSAAVPDGVPFHPSTKERDRKGHEKPSAQSGRFGHLLHPSLSGHTTYRVRSGGTDCPTTPDKPLTPNVIPLKSVSTKRARPASKPPAINNPRVAPGTHQDRFPPQTAEGGNSDRDRIYGQAASGMGEAGLPTPKPNDGNQGVSGPDSTK
jgi:hypothetical protein